MHIAKTGKAPDGNSSKEERLQESVHVATLGTGEGPHGNGQLGCREVMLLSTELPGAQWLRAGASLGTIPEPGDQPRGRLFVPGRGLLSTVSGPHFHCRKPQDSGDVAEPGGQAPDCPVRGAASHKGVTHRWVGLHLVFL